MAECQVIMVSSTLSIWWLQNNFWNYFPLVNQGKFPSQPRQMTLRHRCAVIPGDSFHSADRLQMCPWRCTTNVLSRLLQNNLLPSLFFSYLNIGASWHLQALDSPRPQPNISPRCSVYNYKLHCLNLTTCISTSNLHKPAPQVAAEDIADPLHLHPMNADLQIPLLGSPEIFFLLKEKMKSIKKHDIQMKDLFIQSVRFHRDYHHWQCWGLKAYIEVNGEPKNS